MMPFLAPVFRSDSLKGSNGRSNMFFIRMNSAADPYGAIVAQERYEWSLKWRLVLLFLGIVGPLAYQLEPLLLAPVFVIGVLLTRLPMFARFMEYRGHAIEVAAAVRFFGRDMDLYERQEAEALAYGYGGLFGKDPDVCQRELRKRRVFADKWVRRWGWLIK